MKLIRTILVDREFDTSTDHYVYVIETIDGKKHYVVATSEEEAYTMLTHMLTIESTNNHAKNQVEQVRMVIKKFKKDEKEAQKYLEYIETIVS